MVRRSTTLPKRKRRKRIRKERIDRHHRELYEVILYPAASDVAAMNSGKEDQSRFILLSA